MTVDIEATIDSFELNSDNLSRTLEIIKSNVPFALSNGISSFSLPLSTDIHDDALQSPQEKLNLLYHKLELKSRLYQFPDAMITDICNILEKIVDIIMPFDLNAARKIAELRLSWDNKSPVGWSQLGIIMYQQFLSRKVNDIQSIIDVFTLVIDLVTAQEREYELGFWAYSYMANLYLYRILSGDEALEGAMKHYNQAYRFAQIYNIDVGDEFIFENVEIVQNILMNQYPLLVIIYNHTGMKIFEYLFQFVEVITQDQRFIPNFTALLSVVDERINELFNSPISDAYIIIENRLMVISKLYDENKKNWIKIAFVFSYLHQADDDVIVKQDILKKVKDFSNDIMEMEEIQNYLVNFNGRHDVSIYDKIEEFIQEVFT